jgi:anaerobic ribonucleoside-triphosphate reductase activating protein
MKPLKYYDVAIVFAEFPDEVTLAVNISNCPGMCSHCSEPWLLEDVGTVLTNDEIDKLISEHSDITTFGLMGGDSNHDDCIRVAKYIHDKYPSIKVGMYSGREFINLELAQHLDYYKIGRWIMPEGPSSDWHKTNNGVLQFPWSNQLLFQNINGALVNITYKFRKHPVGNPERYIIYSEESEG